MKYYLVYEEYVDYNIFEGHWEMTLDTYSNRNLAESARNVLLSGPRSNNYRKVSPILVEAK